MDNIVDSYAKRLHISNKIYNKLTNKELSDDQKAIIASILNDCNRLVNVGFMIDSCDERLFAGQNKKLLLNFMTVFCGIFSATYTKSQDMVDFLGKLSEELGDFYDSYLNKQVTYNDDEAVSELESKYKEEE